ncbi:NADPH-dependent FMN reductase [Luteipulveratus halotolerans]|uniref:NADPH-dependent FMN reductase n=1 Tax=Luteipulveratus halotolerans TaxID=1631356 RepID=A0A0L6CLS7_9MICO|nr:NAD(P)H-dependent oxidoreductase [Luteipulveratus halotolerans]KNX38585.1 NADPH-dependent FMN reductase [Luteipulveratus halotolerans]
MDTSKMRIVLLVGSVRTSRMADPIVAWLRAQLAQHTWIDLDVIDLATVRLPEAELRPGSGDSPIADRMNAADGFVVLTPEYNHSFPAALKNAIDWHYTEWTRKPVTFVAYGAGSGGIRAIEQLRLIFPELSAVTTRNVVTLSAPWNHLGDNGFEPPEQVVGALEATVAELHWWATALRVARGRDAADLVPA